MPVPQLYHLLAGCFEPLAATAILLGLPWSLWKLKSRGRRVAIVSAWGIVLLMCCWRAWYADASKRYIYMLIFPCVFVTASALKDLVFSKRFQPWLRIAAVSFLCFIVTCCIIKCFRFNPNEGSIRDGCAVIRRLSGNKKFPLAIVAPKEIKRVQYYTRIPCIGDDALQSGRPISARLSLLQKKYAQVADMIFVVSKSPTDEWKTSEKLPDGAEIVFQNHVDKKKKYYFTVVALKTGTPHPVVPPNVSGDHLPAFENTFEPDEMQRIKPFRNNLVNRGLTFFYNPKIEWPKNWIPAIPGDVLFSSECAGEIELIRAPDGKRRILRMKSRTEIGMQCMENFDFHGAMNIRISAAGTPGSRFILKVLDINEKWQHVGVRQEKIFLIANDREEHFDCFVPASPERFRFAIKLLHGEITINDIKIFPAAGAGASDPAKRKSVGIR